jgi:hypothetical protein
MQIVWLCLALLSAPAQAGESTLLPAYAHNDYWNPRPLQGALEMGYRGVEADYFVIDGELLVALDPLRELIEVGGSVYGDGSVFLLNIESKEEGKETYEALHHVLAEYRDILTVVEDGKVIPGPLQVVLVGWHPPLEELKRQPLRYVSVQMHFKDLPENHAAVPSHLLKVITLNFRETFRWEGHGPPSDRILDRLAAVVAARDAVPGRLVRAYEVPHEQAVYRSLLDAGVDLIGTRNLEKTRYLLRAIEDRAPTNRKGSR